MTSLPPTLPVLATVEPELVVVADDVGVLEFDDEPHAASKMATIGPRIAARFMGFGPSSRAGSVSSSWRVCFGASAARCGPRVAAELGAHHLLRGSLSLGAQGHVVPISLRRTVAS